MRNERLVVSRERLLDEVWGYDPMAATNTIDVFISNLRRKLEAGGEPRLLHTKRGAGYVLKDRHRATRARRRRLRPGTWPVRWRLAAASAGLTLAILLVFAAVIGNLAAERVRSDFNRELRGAASTLASKTRILDTAEGTLVLGPHLQDFSLPNGAIARVLNRLGESSRPRRTPSTSAPVSGPSHDLGHRCGSRARGDLHSIGGTSRRLCPVRAPRRTSTHNQPALAAGRGGRARRHPARQPGRPGDRRPRDAPDRLADRDRPRDRRHPRPLPTDARAEDRRRGRRAGPHPGADAALARRGASRARGRDAEAARVRRRRLARAAHPADQRARQPRAASRPRCRRPGRRKTARWSTRPCAPRGG